MDLDQGGNQQPWVQNSYQGPTLGNTRTSAGRRFLLAPLTLYINNVSGNDNNDGMASTRPFASFAAAAKVILNDIDTQGFSVTIQAAAGQTWTNLTFIGEIVGGGTVVFDVGSGTLIGNINGGSAFLLGADSSTLTIQNCTVTGTGGSNGLTVSAGTLRLGIGVTFGACSGVHVFVDSNASRFFANANYAISGGASNHYFSLAGGLIDISNSGLTITLTGTPAITIFAAASACGIILAFATYSGAATGQKYNANLNGVIWTNTSGNVNWLPGNAAGATGTGGQYS